MPKSSLASSVTVLSAPTDWPLLASTPALKTLPLTIRVTLTMNRGTVARIDPIALQHNLHTIKQQAPHSRVWAVVKADGYGHGAIACATALSHPEAIVCPDGFAVATLQEAKSLRLAGITQPILMLEGAASVHEVQQAAELALTLMIHQAHQIDWLESLGSEQQIAVLVKVDTGMHRLGFDENDINELLNILTAHQGLKVLSVLSVKTSLDFSYKQKKSFDVDN